MHKRIDKINSLGKLLLQLLCITAYFVFSEFVLNSTIFSGTRTDFDYHRNLVLSQEESEKAEKFMRDIISLGKERQESILGTIIFKYKPAVRESFTLNSDGFRNDEFKEKEPDEFRIAVYGDSKVFGFALQNEDTVSFIAEKKLREHFHRNIRVLNMGVEGYDIQRAVAAAEYYNEKIKPDMVVFYSWILDLYNAFDRGNGDWEPFKGGEKLVPGIDGDGSNTISDISKLLKTLQYTYLSDSAKVTARMQDSEFAKFPIPANKVEFAETFPESYLGRMNDASIYFERLGVRSLFILPPLIQTKEPLSDNEKYVLYLNELGLPGISLFSLKCIEGVRKALETGKYGSNIVDHSEIFQGELDTVFFDGIHMVPRFARMAADRIADEIIRTLEKEK